MNPGPSGVVPSALVEGATVSSNRPRHDLCQPTPLSTPPSRHLGSLTAANSVSFIYIVSCSFCWGWASINTLIFKKNSASNTGSQWQEGITAELGDSAFEIWKMCSLHGIDTTKLAASLLTFPGGFACHRSNSELVGTTCSLQPIQTVTITFELIRKKETSSFNWASESTNEIQIWRLRKLGPGFKSRFLETPRKSLDVFLLSPSHCVRAWATSIRLTKQSNTRVSIAPTWARFVLTVLLLSRAA